MISSKKKSVNKMGRKGERGKSTNTVERESYCVSLEKCALPYCMFTCTERHLNRERETYQIFGWWSVVVPVCTHPTVNSLLDFSCFLSPFSSFYSHPKGWKYLPNAKKFLTFRKPKNMRDYIDTYRKCLWIERNWNICLSEEQTRLYSSIYSWLAMLCS